MTPGIAFAAKPPTEPVVDPKGNPKKETVKTYKYPPIETCTHYTAFCEEFLGWIRIPGLIAKSPELEVLPEAPPEEYAF